MSAEPPEAQAQDLDKSPCGGSGCCVVHALNVVFSNSKLLLSGKRNKEPDPGLKELSVDGKPELDAEVRVKSIVKSFLIVGTLGLLGATYAFVTSWRRQEFLQKILAEHTSSSKWPLAKRPDLQREMDEQYALMRMMYVMVPIYVYLLIVNGVVWRGVTKRKDRLTFIGLCAILIQVIIEGIGSLFFVGIQYYLPTYLQVASILISVTEALCIAGFLSNRIQELKGEKGQGQGTSSEDNQVAQLEAEEEEATEDPEPKPEIEDNDEDILSESTIEYLDKADELGGAGKGDTPRPTCGKHLIENHTRSQSNQFKKPQ